MPYLNGSGFPAETGGAFTSDMTRIVMVTDRYDELMTGFGGASPDTPHQSLQRLYQEGQEGKYEARLISLFVKVMGIYPVYSYVALTTGERAIVSVINTNKLHQPIVTITRPFGTTLYRPARDRHRQSRPRGAPTRIRFGLGGPFPKSLSGPIADTAIAALHETARRFSDIAQPFPPAIRSEAPRSGFRRGLIRGIQPEKEPTASENTQAVAIDSNEIMVGHPAITVVSLAPHPAITPITPPNRPSVIASMRNCVRMCALRTTAMRTRSLWSARSLRPVKCS